ncbi:MAG: hypothetical protein RLQ25_12105 [Alphaproteobacteria bacterium]
MLAERDAMPDRLPPGFSYVEGEPAFDAARHLMLEKPAQSWSLEDVGYDPARIGQYASPVALLTPVRLLTDEGVAALQQAIEACMPRSHADQGRARRLHYCTYHSRFIHDLMHSVEVTDWLSGIFQTPIAPHTMPHLGSQLNLGHDEPGKDIVPWHHDRVSFTMVLSMYDPSKVRGGRFEYFFGTREEAKEILDEAGDLPRNRIVSPACMPGTACLMQGSAIMHRGAPMEAPGYRASLVHSYCARDLSLPDANRTYFTGSRFGVPEGQVSPVFTEWARHKAWVSRAKLGTLMEELPFTEDRTAIIAALREGIADVQGAIARLEEGEVSRERMREQYVRDDELQMATPPFMPGHTAKG